MNMKGTHLSLSYGTKVIYDDTGFNFEDADKVGVVGVNGAGKTTLFKIILGKQKLDEGEIDLPALRLGYLPQEIKIPEEQAEMTVWEYIAKARPVDELQEQLNGEYEKLAKYPESEAIMNRINHLQDLMDSYDMTNLDYELLKIVEKMGLEKLVDKRVVELSGGQKSKVAFARVLFENAGLLLLDEPTNHLDVQTRKFVANYLRNYRGTVMVISHDVDFLDEVTNRTLFVNKVTHKMKVYRGNYTAFRRQYAEERAAEEMRISEQEREIQRIREFVERARNAKRSNTALIRQGHVREKMLERKEAELESREMEYQRVSLDLTPAHLGSKTPIEVQNLSFGYGDELLHDRLSFSLTRGEKFLVVGENGAGKSTLLKLLVGELEPKEGAVILGKGVEMAYYAQELEILDERRTILENVRSYDLTETETRAVLANFLFHDEEIYRKVEVLSPGEKARVALCKILTKRANLILLDEPTNHFDPETQKLIGENFREYPGTVVMVSHNPSFVEEVGITRMLILPRRDEDTRVAKIKNYSPELLEYYYYLNSELV